jgi:predicted amino acid-binding ACT domain protein
MRSVKKIAYCYAKVPNRSGQGAALLDAIADAGVNLVAFTGFPVGGGMAQVDFATAELAALKRVAKRLGLRLSQTKRAFLVQGDDRIGAVRAVLRTLAENRINVIAADAVAAGKGRFGMILWVKPADYTRAAKLLRAR